MTNRALVSVALRACNQGDSILQALESGMAQKVNFPMEIVCGVDLSTDNTIDIVRNFSGKMPKELSLKIIQHGANVWGAIAIAFAWVLIRIPHLKEVYK